MTNLLYRNSTAPTTPGSTTFKGTALSFDELDGNFKSLSDDIGTREVTANKNNAYGYAGLSSSKALQLINTAGSFISVLQNASTAIRTYTLKDADGTVAFTSDITGTNSGTNTGDNAVNTLYSGLATSKQDASTKDLAGGFVGISAGYQINFKNAANTFLSLMTNANSASRTYTFQDRNGTVALTSDITGTNSGTNTGDQVNITGNAAYATSAGYATTAGSAPANGGTSSAVTINYSNISGGTYQMLWGSANGVFGSTSINCVPTSGQLNVGSLVSTGDVTAYSDERLKTNWRDLPNDFIRELSLVKTGIYDRLDQDTTQVGVSAQSLQQVLPNSVITDEFGMLSVSYGQAALAACVMLAREIQILKSKG